MTTSNVCLHSGHVAKPEIILLFWRWAKEANIGPQIMNIGGTMKWTNGIGTHNMAIPHHMLRVFKAFLRRCAGANSSTTTSPEVGSPEWLFIDI